MTLEEIEKEFLEFTHHSSDCEEADFLRRHFPEMLHALKCFEKLIGPQELGKCIDLTIQWDGAVSGIMNGKTLWDCVKAMNELER